MGDGGECAGENEHAEVVAKDGIAGPGLPVWGAIWRRAFAGVGLVSGRVDVAVIGLRAGFRGDGGELVGGRYGIC